MLRAIGRYNSLFLVMAIYLQPIAHSTHSGNERVSWHFQLVTQSLDIHRQGVVMAIYLQPIAQSTVRGMGYRLEVDGQDKK